MNRAVVSDPDHPQRISIEHVPEPSPASNEAVVAVAAFSLNAGEARESLAPVARWRPGWDIAGTVVAAASDGTGPPLGARVVGFAGIGGGGWAARVAVPTTSLAVLPETVTFTQAACLPVAGLTALFALDKRGSLLGRAVLVTGASGGVGQLGCQLAVAAGADVVASVRRPHHAQALAAFGLRGIVAADEPLPHRFDLILESVGGASLARSITHLAADGVCVLFGNSTAEPTTITARDFYHPGTGQLYGLFLGSEVGKQSVADGLRRLLLLTADGRLTIPVTTERPWTDLPTVARSYQERAIAGKAVLRIDDEPS